MHSDAGQECLDLCEAAGVRLDPWQRLSIYVILSRNDRNRWAAVENAVLVARQNGKGEILLALTLYWLFLSHERLIVHTAHEFKALDVATPILTARGWSTMGALRPGDEVFAPDGQPTKVLAAHPVRHGRPCYRLRFDDGQEIVADGEHLWEVFDTRYGKTRVVTTQQIIEGGVARVEPRRDRPRRTYRWRVAVPDPLVQPERDLPLDPWLLGAWLGDGSTGKGQLTVGAADLAYMVGRLDALGESYRVRGDPRWPDRVLTITVAGLPVRLRAAGVFWDKRIPDAYLFASEAQRRDLLAGLMDTDGTVSGHRLHLTMKRADLMADVTRLARSLGYKATLRGHRASMGGRDAGPVFRLAMRAAQRIPPFQMPRKAELVVPEVAQATRGDYNAIVAVEPVPSRPTRCITVAHESSLYLAGDGFVPTHNTAGEAFLRLKAVLDANDWLNRRIKTERTSHGEEGYVMRGGERLRFLARSRSSGRGFTGDKVILDEAQELSSLSMAALMPTLSARPDPQLIYMGTVPGPQNDSGHWTNIMTRGRKGDSTRLAWLEWNYGERLPVEATYDGDDPVQVKAREVAWLEALYAANPALGIRLDEDYCQGERESLAYGDYLRERLNIWSNDPVTMVIPMDTWLALADPESTLVGRRAIAVDCPPGLGSSTISAMGRNERGQWHGEVVAREPGTGWVPTRVAEVVRKNEDVALVVVDPGSPAGALITDIEAEGVEVMQVTTREHAQGCGMLYARCTQRLEGADGRQFVHLGDEILADALKVAVKRPGPDGTWMWNRKESGDDISPLVALTLAGYGLSTLPEPVDNVWGFWS